MPFEDQKIGDVIKAASERAFKEMVQDICKAFFAKRWGYSDGERVQEALKDEVRTMLQTDPELRDKIKKRLIDLIEKGAAY